MSLVFLKKIILPISVFTMLLFAIATPANAQVSGLSLDKLKTTVSPESPGPDTTVSIRVESFSFDINRSTITWILNDTVAQQGRGVTDFEFTTGSLGSISRVTVSVASPDGFVFSRNFTIRPSEVDLLWEADTNTPAFYKGKALATSESEVTVTAMPHFITSNGARVSPKEVLYTWSENRRVLGDKSGYGKQSVTITAPKTGLASTVSVEATSLDGTFKAERRVSIGGYSPHIIFYEKHPLEGIRYYRAPKKTMSLTEDEITLHAEPYFFSRKDILGNNLTFSWQMNNRTISPSNAHTNEIVFRAPDGVEGISEVKLSIRNTKSILQEAAANLFISFTGGGGAFAPIK